MNFPVMAPQAPQLALTLDFGKFNALRFALSATDVFIYKPIADVVASSPCVLTVTGHGVPDGWVFFIERARGMHQLNRTDFYEATVTDANHIEINALDTVGWSSYVPGSGRIRYEAPVGLMSAAFARFYASMDSDTPLLALEVGDGLELDQSRHAINLEITPGSELPPGTYAWELYMVDDDDNKLPVIRRSLVEVLP